MRDIIEMYVPDLHLIYAMLQEMKDVEQDKTWHPEGSVWNHSVQSFLNAYHESMDLDFILAALCHDFGKAIDKKEHTYWSLKLLKGILSPRTEWLIYQHMRMHYFFDGCIKKWSKVEELLTHPWFIEAAHLARIDKMSRVEKVMDDLSYWQLEEMLINKVAMRFQLNQRRKKAE